MAEALPIRSPGSATIGPSRRSSIARSRRRSATSVPVSLVLIDLDDFKAINDTNGHALGDQALARLRAAGRARGPAVVDRSFRIGGDEFAILLPHTDAEGAGSWSAPPARDRAPARPARAGDRAALVLGRHLGPARPGAEPRAAVHAGRCRPVRSKRAGRTEVVVFDRGDGSVAPPLPAERSAADRRGHRRHQLRPVYQPIVELATCAILGYEGLIRPTRRPRSPIPAACSRRPPAAATSSTLDLACIETIVAGAPACRDASSS